MANLYTAGYFQNVVNGTTYSYFSENDVSLSDTTDDSDVSGAFALRAALGSAAILATLVF